MNLAIPLHATLGQDVTASADGALRKSGQLDSVPAHRCRTVAVAIDLIDRSDTGVKINGEGKVAPKILRDLRIRKGHFDDS